MVLTAGCRMQGVGGRHEAAVQKQRKGWDVIIAKAPGRGCGAAFVTFGEQSHCASIQIPFSARDGDGRW